MDTNKTGGELLTEQMRARDLKDAEAGEMIGCSPAQVCKLRADRQPPSLRLAVVIEDVFGVPTRTWVARQP